MKNFGKHFFALFGIVLLAFAVLMVTTSAGANKRCTESVMGTVTGYREEYDAHDRSTSYFPIVEYSANRKHIEASANSGSGSTPYEIGSTVTVRYNPDDPYEFVFEGDNSAIKWGIYLVVVGIGCIVLDVLAAKGVVHVSEKHYYHRSRNGQGVSIDLMGVADTVKFAKTMKGTVSNLRNMTPEERKALYEAVNNHPEQFVDIQNEDTDSQ